MSNPRHFTLPLKYWAVIFALIILVPILGAQYLLNYKFLREVNHDYIENSLAHLTNHIENALLYPLATADKSQVQRIADGIVARIEVFAIDVRDAEGNRVYRAEDPTFSLEQGNPMQKEHIRIVDTREVSVTDALADTVDNTPFTYGEVTLYITPTAMSGTFEQQLLIRTLSFIAIILVVAGIIYGVSNYIRHQVYHLLAAMQGVDGAGALGLHSRVTEIWEIAVGLAGLMDQTQSNIAELQNAQATAECALAEAEQASELKAEFIHNMSHEIRTPTNSITNLIEVLEQQARRAKVDPLFLQHLLICKQASVELRDAIEELADFEKIESGDIPIAKRPTDLSEFFATFPITYTAKFDAKNITFRVLHEDNARTSVEPMMLDDKKLHRVLVNLLENAFKYTEHGSVTLGWAVLKEATGWRLNITVADSGIGMSEADCARVFTRFYRVENPVKKRQSGYGLGLTIVKKIVEGMAGCISVSSRLRIGSTFSLSIPIEPVPTLEAPATDQMTLPEHLFAVIIDDNDSNCYTMTQLLTEMGVRSQSFTNPEEALDALKSQRADVLFVDYHMPQIDGMALSALVRKLPINANATIICVTADTHPNVKDLVAGSAADGLLIKPIQSAELYRILANVVAARDCANNLILQAQPRESRE